MVGIFLAAPWDSILLGGLITAFVLLVGFGLGRRGSTSQDASKLTTNKPSSLSENPGEKRQDERRRGGNIAVLVADGEGKGQPWTGWVNDRSPHGLGYIAEKGELPGALLKVRPKDAGENIPWVKVVVRNCREQGHQFEIGCQFLEQPSMGVFWYFG